MFLTDKQTLRFLPISLQLNKQQCLTLRLSGLIYCLPLEVIRSILLKEVTTPGYLDVLVAGLANGKPLSASTE
jgi:hypothetical protein